MDQPASFGYWVRRRRKALDLTQAELARRVGCAEVTIQKIEADERRPSPQIAELLAKHLQIPSGEQAAFLRSARGELAPDRLAEPDTVAAVPRHNLPVQLTSFVGRTRELAALATLLAESRLLTLTGPGGTGKTRLALELAIQTLDRFSDGTWLVELASLSKPAAVVPAIATALGLREEPGRPLLASLTAFLRPKQILLVLDNCEHLIQVCAQVAGALLQTCPRLRILASSIEPLGVPGEAIFRVPALSAPNPADQPPLDQLAQYEAIQLFVARARAVQPNFELTTATAVPVAQICARLDGIPLAIELAAARLRMLTVAQIAARLDDRFHLLTGGSRIDLPRHQTLQALIDWSYELLSEAERVLLRRLAVFPGSLTLEAAEAVTTSNVPIFEHASVLDLLTHLVDKSLVQVDQAGDAARYRMLETIRQYALAKLADSGELDTLRRNHATYYLALAETNQPGPSEFSLEWLGRIWDEMDNLRAALAWSQTAAGDSDIALRLVVVVGSLFEHSEAVLELERALNHPRGVERTAAYARARVRLGVRLALLGDLAGAQAQHNQALSLYREVFDWRENAYVLWHLGWLARERGDVATAWASFEESLALSRQHNDMAGAANTLLTMAEVAVVAEDADRAAALLEESIAVGRAYPDPQRHGWTLNHQGHVAQLRGEHDRAHDLYVKSLDAAKEIFGEQSLEAAWAYQGLSEAALAQGDIGRAASWLRQALDLNRDIGDRVGVAWCLAGLGTAAALDEEPERAARLWGAAEALRQKLGCRPAPAARANYERALALARAQLGEEGFAATWAAGQALPLEDAIAEALANIADSSMQ